MDRKGIKKLYLPENSDRTKYLPSFISKMKREKSPPLVIDTFTYYYKRIVSGATGLISDRDITPVAPDEIEDATRIKEYAGSGRKALRHAVIIKLNGGLGTSMGLTRAKSLLPVKNEKTFLEVIVRQAETCRVKLALMNSFSTHEDTIDALSMIKPSDFPLLFIQNRFPKILQKDLAPATWPGNRDLEWNPPGHGDIYSAIYISGVLNSLLGKGIEYAFISNSDNLGATMDESLLGYFCENRLPFMMEVVPRTPSDVKGGHIARHINGRLILRESAQCPQDEMDAFRDIKRYRFFNTNNIWINLKSLKKLIEKHNTINLPMIKNRKTINPRDENSPKVFQVETAMGAAISLFEGAAAIRVPASRFSPVKKCNDLLAIRSDRFVFSEKNNLILNPKAGSRSITIALDPKYYGKIDNFDERFSEGIPSLIHCEALTIDGDVRFEKNVTIKGSVVIKNNGQSQAVIKQGSVIDTDVIFN
jgi:UTP--glucose-1-phosphate uridylyltransferase